MAGARGRRQLAISQILPLGMTNGEHNINILFPRTDIAELQAA